MSVLIDARPHAAAIKAALDAALAPAWVSFEYDKVPGTNGNAGTAPGIFVALSLERRTNPLLRTPGRAGAAGWRVALRSVGRTVAECRWAQLRVADALNEQRLFVAGEYSNRLQFESGDAPGFDDGRYSAIDLYTYVR